MGSFTVIVDSLSSVAAIVAIATVLVAWFRSRRPPVDIPRVIISPRGTHLRAFVEIKNTRLYPITINSFACYRKSTYKIHKKKNEKPSLYPSFDVANRLFVREEPIQLTELGEYTGEFYFGDHDYNPKRMIFIFHTSHGHFHQKPRNVVVIDEEFSIVAEGDQVEAERAMAARLQYLKSYASYIFQRLRRGWR